ncbi:MAG: Rrf2 family transcriptional regulator [Nitrospiraceae bacterium]|nr:Rrf2 family transcriptional regulator [Nitrospiraceae bacterium]
MNVTLSRRGDYVVRAAICLSRAFQEGKGCKIREVADQAAIPASFAPQVMADLVRSGLATSRAGRNGGYRLARDPADISVLEVIEAGEGEIHSDLCAMGEGPCYWENVCPLHESWREALHSFRKGLSGSTLASLAQRDRELEAGLIEAPADSHRHAHAGNGKH